LKFATYSLYVVLFNSLAISAHGGFEDFKVKKQQAPCEAVSATLKITRAACADKKIYCAGEVDCSSECPSPETQVFSGVRNTESCTNQTSQSELNTACKTFRNISAELDRICINKAKPSDFPHKQDSGVHN